MTSQQSQNTKCKEQQEGEKASTLEGQGLPMESSPYVKYTDLEDYKNKGYGTQGHLQPKPHQGGIGTDAPTIPGDSLPAPPSIQPGRR